LKKPTGHTTVHGPYLTDTSITALALVAFTLALAIGGIISPAWAQTEYDSNLQQAQQQEDQYRHQIDAEDEKIEPYREAYMKRLDDLDRLSRTSPIAHGKNDKHKTQISSLVYWLQHEREKEAKELAALQNLDGWRIYWQSKKDSVIRTQAWNDEQVEIDQRAAVNREFEAQSLAARNSRDAALKVSEDEYNYDGGYYGGGGRSYGGGGYYGGGGRSYGGGHSYHGSSGHSGHSSGGHSGGHSSGHH
jgi:hypothetical protein